MTEITNFDGNRRIDGLPVVQDPDWTDDDRAYQAHKLRMAGHDWKTVAELTGYKTPSAAKVCTTTYLQRAAVQMSIEQKREALALSLDRLEGLINTYWSTAMLGEVKHAEVVLKVIAQQAKLLGLEELATKQEDASTKTILVSGNNGEYVRALQLVVDRSAKRIEHIPSTVGDDDYEDIPS